MENPYAPPKSNDLSGPALAAVHISGKALVLPKEFTFPPICIKTGEAENLVPLQKRRLSWYPPLMIVLVALSPLVFAIIALIFRKKGLIHFQLTKEIARKRKSAIMRNWLLFFASFGAFFMAAKMPDNQISIFVLAGTVLFLASLIGAIIAARFLRPQKIDKVQIQLLGIPPEVQQRIVELCQLQAV